MKRLCNTTAIWRNSETADLPFNKLAEILGSLLKGSRFIYCFNRRENVRNSDDEFQVNNDRMKNYQDNRQFPNFYMKRIDIIKVHKGKYSSNR